MQAPPQAPRCQRLSPRVPAAPRLLRTTPPCAQGPHSDLITRCSFYAETPCETFDILGFHDVSPDQVLFSSHFI